MGGSVLWRTHLHPRANGDPRAGSGRRLTGGGHRQFRAGRPPSAPPRRRAERGLRRASCPAHRAFEALGSERSRGCRRANHGPLRCTAHGTEPCAQENSRHNGLTTNARESVETDGSPGADGRSKLAGHRSFRAITGYPRNLPVDSSGPWVTLSVSICQRDEMLTNVDTQAKLRRNPQVGHAARLRRSAGFGYATALTLWTYGDARHRLPRGRHRRVAPTRCRRMRRRSRSWS
jgi:hypothetical protein